MRQFITAAAILATASLAIGMFTGAPARGQSDDGYTGSAKCYACHTKTTNVAAWSDHGHATMLTPVLDGKKPEAVDVEPPAGMTWNDIAYVIGGSIYACFVDKTGHVVTGPEAQWSITGKTHTPFMPDVENGTLAYDCVKCHTTGWKESGGYENGVGNDLPGIPGDWFENSVGCESCHDPGAEHAALSDKEKTAAKKGDRKIVIDSSVEQCGTCHKMTDDDTLLLSHPDLVQSQQQYTEWKLGKHAAFKVTCVACHDPHAAARSENGITRKCLDCHKARFAKEIKITAMEGLSCSDCHMPTAARGAYDSMIGNYHQGDTKSHLFGITADENYVLDDGSGKAAINEDGHARLTVEMTCFRCHQSGGAKELSREELLKEAKRVHGS